MSRRRKVYLVHGSPRTMTVHTGGVGFGKILLHTLLTCLTGGFWLIILLVRYMLR